MSEEVEKRIVSLEFDGSKFDSKLKKSQKSLENFKKSLNLDKEIRSFDELEKAADVDLSPLEKSIYKVEQRFTAFEMVALSVINRVTNKVIDLGERMVESLTIDNARTGWTKYEEQITAVQTLMSNVRAEVEAINEESLFYNFNDDVQKMEYIEGFYERISKFADETSAGISESMSALGKFSAQGKDLATSEDAVYGIYALTASAGRPIAEGAQNADLFAKIAGRSLMAADYYSLSARQLNTSKFINLLLETATQDIETTDGTIIQHTLEKVEGGYKDVSKGAMSTANSLMDVSQKYKNAMTTFADAASAFSGITSNIAGDESGIITEANFSSMLSSKWLRGDFVMEAVKQYGKFWRILSPIIDKTEIGATTWSRALRTYKKAFDENGELVESAEHYRDEAYKLLVDSGISSEAAQQYLEALSTKELELSREAFLNLQEATKLSEALDSARIAVAGRFSTIYQSLFGNYLQARDLFTNLSEWLYDKFVTPIDRVSKEISLFSKGYEWFFDVDENGDTVLISQLEDESGEITKFARKIAYDFINEAGDVIHEELTGFEFLEKIYSAIGPAIDTFVEPIKESFEFVFGNFTFDTFENIGWKILNFLNDLAANDTIFYTIQSVATTIFTIIKALGKALSSLWTAMAPVRAMAGTVMEVVAEIVTLISDLVTSIFSVGEATTETGEKLSVFQPVVNALLYLFGIIKQIFDGIYNYLNENGVLSKIANALSQIFFTVSDILAAIIYGIADAIGGLAQFLTESSFIQETVAFISAAFTKISEAVKNIISATKNAFISIFNAVKGFFSKIASGDFTDAKKLGTSIFNIFKFIIGGLTQMIAAGTADGTLVTFLKVLLSAIADVLKGTITEFAKLVDAVLDNLYVIIAKAWTKFKPLIADIILFLMSAVDFQFINTCIKAMFAFAIALGAVNLAIRIFTDGLALLNVAIGAKQGAFKSPLGLLAMAVEDLTTGVWEKGKAAKWFGFAATIASFAVVIGSVIAAVLLLKDVPANDLWRVVGVIAAVSAVMGAIVAGMAILMSRFGKLTESKDAKLDKLLGSASILKGDGSIDATGSANQNTTGIGKVALIMLGMAAFILAIGVAVGIMAQALTYAQKQGIGSNVIMGMLAMILGFMTLIMGELIAIVALADKTKEKTSTTAMSGIGKKGLSGDFLREWEGTGLYALGVPILALAVLAAGIGFAMAKLAQAFETFKANGMTTNEFMIVFGILSGVLVAIMGAMVFMVAFAKQNTGDAISSAGKGQYKKLLKIALIFSIFALGIGTIVGSIWLLSKVAADMQGIDMEPIGWLALAVIAIMAVVGGLMMLFKLVGWNQLGKIAAMMGIFTVSLASIVGSFWLLGEVAKGIEKVDMDPLWKLVGIIGLFAGIITALGIVAGVLSIWFAPIVTVIGVAIGVLSGLLVAISGSFLLGALALEHAADAAIKMGKNLDTIKKVLDYFVDVINRLTTINTVSGGNMSVAVIAVATAILILASAFAIFAASAWIFGKGLSAIAKGVNDFNKTDFSGLKSITSDMLETIQKFVDMAVGFTAAMAFLQLLSGGMAAVGILEVAAAIALVVTSVTSMIAVVTKLIDVLSKLGDTDPFAKMMSKMDSLKALLINIVDVVMQVTEYAIGKFVELMGNLVLSDKMTELGYSLGKMGAQLSSGAVAGSVVGSISGLGKILEALGIEEGPTLKRWLGKDSSHTSSSGSSHGGGGRSDSTSSTESSSGKNYFSGVIGNIVNSLFGSGNDYEGKYDLKELASKSLGNVKGEFSNILSELGLIGDSVNTIKDQQKEGLDNAPSNMRDTLSAFVGRGIDANDTASLKSNLAVIGSAIESATTVEELKAQAGALMKTTKRLAVETTDEDLRNTFKSIQKTYDDKLSSLSNGTPGAPKKEEPAYIIGTNKAFDFALKRGYLSDIEDMNVKNADGTTYKPPASQTSTVTISTTNNFNGYGEEELKETILETVNDSVERAGKALKLD